MELSSDAIRTMGLQWKGALTEAAQGQDILLYSQRSPFDLYNKNVFDGYEYI